MFSCVREPSIGHYSIKLYQATLSLKLSIQRDALDMWYLTDTDQRSAKKLDVKNDHHYYYYIVMIILMMTEMVDSELWG